MGRLKWLPSFAVVFWEDEPPEERETEERCDSWRRAPSNSVDVCRGTVKIRYVRYVSDRRCIQVFFHRHVRVYPPPTPFRFSRRNQEIPPPFRTRTLITLRTHKLPHLRTCANSTTTYARVGSTSAEFREQVDDAPDRKSVGCKKTTVPVASLRRAIGSDQTLLNAWRAGRKRNGRSTKSDGDCTTITAANATSDATVCTPRARYRGSCVAKRGKKAQCLSTCRCNMTANTKTVAAAAAAAVVVARRTFCTPPLFVPLPNLTGFVRQVTLCFVPLTCVRKVCIFFWQKRSLTFNCTSFCGELGKHCETRITHIRSACRRTDSW